MHSLEQLNVYSNTTITTGDERPPGILLSNIPPINQSITSIEGLTHEVPIGSDILAVYNYEIANVRYSINTSVVANTTVTWDTLPAGMTASNSAGVYSVWPINSALDWNAIKSPTITMPQSYSGTFVYTANIAYTDSNANVQTTGWTIVNVVTPGTDLSLAEDYYFNTTNSAIVSGVPTIIATGNTSPTYTITITPSNANVVTTMSSAGTGGTSSLNGTTKVLTITGTKTQVNSHLSSISLTPSNLSASCVFSYYLTNSLSAVTSSRIQNIIGNDGRYLSLKDSDSYYNEDLPRLISGAPLITDITSNGSGTYSLTISSYYSTYTANISTAGTGGITSFNNTSKILTITGNRTQVNSHLNAITFWSQLDYTSPHILTYTLTTPTANIAVSTQTLYVDVIDTEVTNIAFDRNYTSNSANTIFATNTPQIDDGTANTQVYSISLSTNLGVFTSNETTYTSNWSYTGTKAQINSLFSTIKFYPNRNITTSGTCTYTQIKNGVTQVVQAITLIGVSRTSPISGTGITSYTASQTLSITKEQSLYLKADVLLVGGGGGGGNSGSAYSGIGGGGGGGGANIAVITGLTLSKGNYSVVVGAGGRGGTLSLAAGNGGVSQFASTSVNGGIAGGNGLSYTRPDLPAGKFAKGGTGGKSANNFAGGQSVSYIESGDSYTSWTIGGGGGGGAGGAGTNSSRMSTSPYTQSRGAGGAGVSSSFTGTSIAYAKGGDGGILNGSFPGSLTPGSGMHGGFGAGMPGVVIIKMYTY